MSIIDSLRVPISESTSLEDSDLSTLNEKGFVRAGTAGAQWLLLINESWNKSKLPQNEMVRDYLALMLGRFIKRTDLLDVFIGFEYYQGMLRADQIDSSSVQDLADISMLYVSLYPGRMTYRHYPSSVARSVDLGMGMYSLLHSQASDKDNWWTAAYREMEKAYMQAVMVLKFTSPLLIMEEDKLKRLYGDVLRFPGNAEAVMVSKQAQYFEEMYLRKDLGEVQ